MRTTGSEEGDGEKQTSREAEVTFGTDANDAIHLVVINL
jgi:hypothetical protein